MSVSDLSSRLLVTQNTEEVMGVLAERYPNLSTRRAALTKLRATVIHRNPRHPDYERCMNQKTAELQEAGEQQRLLALYDFRGLSLTRQLQVQKKIIKDGPETTLCDPRDHDFYSKVPLLPDWVHGLRLSPRDARKLSLDQQSRLLAASERVVRIEKAGDLIRKCRAILREEGAGPDPVKVATAIALVTGRRMVEIFLKGHFAEHPTKRYCIVFHGQAKSGLTRLQSMTEDQCRPYNVPTLATASSIVRSMSKLRGNVGPGLQQPVDVNQKWCRKLNAYVRENIHAELTFHDLRTLYALLSYEAFKPHCYGLNGWVCQTLGHACLNMSVHYTRMQVFGVERISRTKNEACEDFSIDDKEESSSVPRGAR